ncbi:hypothetical protein CDAR_568601 [Caerostris darwini]|uniref:Uncharacterized protein n=1 Tax=Caerostris darwini TaxID=1538125 RepID=A0AAV4VSE5_9ARAC|nr:hypothetical protein CDAR_568601 [Caerostris darwini]
MRLCLSRMDEKDPVVVFAPRHAAMIFSESLLDWPLVNLLLPMANRLWRFMSKQDLECLLCSLTSSYNATWMSGFYLYGTHH